MAALDLIDVLEASLTELAKETKKKQQRIKDAAVRGIEKLRALAEVDRQNPELVKGNSGNSYHFSFLVVHHRCGQL